MCYLMLFINIIIIIWWIVMSTMPRPYHESSQLDRMQRFPKLEFRFHVWSSVDFIRFIRFYLSDHKVDLQKFIKSRYIF